MALFENHKKCAHCREKGVGDDPCVKKQDCQICKEFMPSQIIQLATPTYKARKERGEQKKSEASSDATPTLVDPSEVTLLGGVVLTSRLQLNLLPSRRRSVLMALQDPANVNTAVSPLQMISSPLITSGVRGFPV